MVNTINDKDTIVAISTPQGTGGIAVIRVSGPKSKEILRKCWKGADITTIASHTAHLGQIIGENNEPLDEVVLTSFWGPNSFTGEDVVEISCHGSKWIQREIVNLLINHGARPAGPGEFTQRAFMNGRIDLARAEGIADLISASSKAAHRLAMQQANGNFSGKLNSLREQLIEFASLFELELDFSEEDVEFADREKLRVLCYNIKNAISRLADSYKSGRVIKEGIPVVIAGAPNAGKSTLLNAILGEEKAIVTNVPGTTRDIIEDSCELDGILYRFIDTAGLREAEDEVERIGIQRAEQRLNEATIILWLVDISQECYTEEIQKIQSRIEAMPEKSHIILLNKIDKLPEGDNTLSKLTESVTAVKLNPNNLSVLAISTKRGDGLEKFKEELGKIGNQIAGTEEDIVVTNARHYHELREALTSLDRVEEGLETGLSGDFIAQDLRQVLHHLGSITGTITTPDLLTSIFTHFCVGK